LQVYLSRNRARIDLLCAVYFHTPQRQSGGRSDIAGFTLGLVARVVRRAQLPLRQTRALGAGGSLACLYGARMGTEVEKADTAQLGRDQDVLRTELCERSLHVLLGQDAEHLLRHAERTGQGQVIDLSLFDPLFSVLEPQVANWRLTKQRKPRTGSRSTNAVPRNAYRTQDGGWVCLSASTQGMTEKLFRSIDRADMIADPRFATNQKRVENGIELDAIIAAFIRARDLATTLAHFDSAGVTIGPIMDAEQLDGDLEDLRGPAEQLAACRALAAACGGWVAAGTSCWR
jgi:hypothetical protein